MVASGFPTVGAIFFSFILKSRFSSACSLSVGAFSFLLSFLSFGLQLYHQLRTFHLFVFRSTYQPQGALLAYPFGIDFDAYVGRLLFGTNHHLLFGDAEYGFLAGRRYALDCYFAVLIFLVGGDDFHIQFFAAPSRVEGIVEAMLFESDVIVWILGVFAARGKHGQEQHGSGSQLADCFHVVYKYVKETKKLPKSAARSVEDFKEFFEGFLNEGYDQIVHVSISTHLSCICKNAQSAAEQIGKDKVLVIDGRVLSTGTLLLTLCAKELVDQGKSAKEVAEKQGVEIKLYSVIYQALEDVEAAMNGLLEPVYEEKVIGNVEVRQTFKVSNVGTIAGGYVKDGKVERNAGVRVIREDVVIHEGKLASLKRFKDDVKEVAKGFECGLQIENYNDIKEGDIIEVFVMEEIKRTKKSKVQQISQEHGMNK